MYKYQLVLQLQCESIDDFDRFIALEDLLIDRILSSNQIDGHDSGMDEFNIFILTNDPVATFTIVQPLLTESVYSPTFAYRELSGETYTVLWPTNRHTFTIA